MAQLWADGREGKGVNIRQDFTYGQTCGKGLKKITQSEDIEYLHLF